MTWITDFYCTPMNTRLVPMTWIPGQFIIQIPSVLLKYFRKPISVTTRHCFADFLSRKGLLLPANIDHGSQHGFKSGCRRNIRARSRCFALPYCQGSYWYSKQHNIRSGCLCAYWAGRFFQLLWDHSVKQLQLFACNRRASQTSALPKRNIPFGMVIMHRF